jgi:hypothetical protein
MKTDNKNIFHISIKLRLFLSYSKFKLKILFRAIREKLDYLLHPFKKFNYFIKRLYFTKQKK